MIIAYSNFNLGDDLFIKILCERYPNIKFVLYAPKEYKKSFRKNTNLSIFPSNNIIIRGLNFLFKTLKIKTSIPLLISKKCKAIVQIGGSIFIESEGWRNKKENKKRMLNENRPFFVLGANFGPFKDNDFYLWNKEMFRKYADICFREKHSYEMFNDLENVRMADDIVFQLNKKEFKQGENNIVISVIKPSYRKELTNYDDIYYNKIKDITIYFIKKGYKVTLMSFCENEGDKEAIEKIMRLIPFDYLNNNVKKYFYKLDMEEALNIISASNFVIATRFHSMILGWVYNKPVFPIVYSDKMTNVMKDIGFTGSYTDFNNIYELKPQQVFDSMETNLIDVLKQVKNAEKHFEKLDEYLLK